MKLIQKFGKFLLLPIVFLLASCGGDDGDGDITGTYTVTGLSISDCLDLRRNIDLDLDDDGCQIVAGTELCVTGSFTLTETTFTVTFTVSAGGQNQTTNSSGTYTLDGNTITICDGTDCENSRFNSSSNELTITLPPDSDRCVLSFSGEK